MCSDSALFQYYLKLVPTLYVTASGDKTYSMSYSVSEHVKPISMSNPGMSHSIPGLFTMYELSPFMLKFTEVRPSFFSFVTSLCAIVGGVVTLAGLVDACLFHAMGAKGHHRVAPRAELAPSHPTVMQASLPPAAVGAPVHALPGPVRPPRAMGRRDD